MRHVPYTTTGSARTRQRQYVDAEYQATWSYPGRLIPPRHMLFHVYGFLVIQSHEHPSFRLMVNSISRTPTCLRPGMAEVVTEHRASVPLPALSTHETSRAHPIPPITQHVLSLHQAFEAQTISITGCAVAHAVALFVSIRAEESRCSMQTPRMLRPCHSKQSQGCEQKVLVSSRGKGTN